TVVGHCFFKEQNKGLLSGFSPCFHIVIPFRCGIFCKKRTRRRYGGQDQSNGSAQAPKYSLKFSSFTVRTVIRALL
ncbi:MAG: hypothetical protein ACI4GO_07020, partial [Hominenteromicrobium sp.]